MAKMSKFMDFLKLSDPDDDFDDDDLFGDDDDYEEYEQPKKKAKPKAKVSNSYYDDDDEDEDYTPKKTKQKPARTPSKLVAINSRNNSNRSTGTVRVIKPQEFNEAQAVTDYLKEGDSIVINMEGIEVHAAQRIIDFIGGACYALDGSLQGISSNIFIAAPQSITVTGDLREEILNNSTFAPELTSF